MSPFSGIDVHQLTRELFVQNDSKIVMLVADGLGGLPMEPGGKTELETARTPHLDALAVRGVQGGSIPVFPGISPGSGPGHLALFGYDPIQYQIGRGALEATGIGFELQPGDVAARGNFCTLDSAGRITDRRAGRIATDASSEIVRRLQSITVPGVKLFVEPVKEHRFVVVFRGAGGDAVDDTDPQRTGVEPLAPVARDDASKSTAQAAAAFIDAARELLRSEPQANGMTLRGFAARPHLESYAEVYGLRAAAIAVYPMYRGLASLVGMKNAGSPKTLVEQVTLLETSWRDYDFFFLHFKYTDSTGEDGDFAGKVRRIEEFDAIIPRVLALQPNVVIVTGDHSTPSYLKSHSWHPVPTLIVSDRCRPDHCQVFAESESYRGGLGLFPAKFIMPLALSNAGRLTKFGA
jgi:2,3-bisphosphoglycerate-independent phosphoglycerate mutase